MTSVNPEKNLITRIVQLTLHPDKRDDFLKLFAKASSKIRQMPGCIDVKLLQHTRFPNIVSTLSLWDDESSLDAYRQTEFFSKTWSETKLLFAGPPRADSYINLSE